MPLRRPSYGDEEDIVVKPSTELIADEYEHSLKSTKNIEVYTFATENNKDKENVRLFTETLNNNNYQIKPQHSHCLDKDNIFEVLKRIHNNAISTTTPLDGLILYFTGFPEMSNTNSREGVIGAFDGKEFITLNIQDIWVKFTSDKCPELRNKPKIFIFHITSGTTIETDGRLHKSITYNLAYETPAEADILIVYHKSDPSYQLDFTDQLCDNINRYGKNEDIISLITCIDSSVFDTRPMIISTLTRKFYFTASDYRGLHLDIDESHKQLKKDLKEVEEKLSQVNTKKEKKKKHFSFTLGKKRLEEHPPEVGCREHVINKSNKFVERSITVQNSDGNINEVKSVTNQNKSRKISKSELDGKRPRWTFSFKKIK